ncbi:MAG: sigma-70 family RNA polymerase sigma factor [Clostridia bacterium]|nr:sigma-70 family RNA polymerase sigma factor [Clostridia bacterium]
MLDALLLTLQTEEDRTYFKALYYEYLQTVIKVARDHLFYPSDLEDCVQGTFLDLIRYAERFRAVPKEKQRAYIAKTCKRVAYRLNQRHSNTVFVEDLTEKERLLCDDSDLSVYDQLELAEAINKLDDKYREPLIMKYADGFSVAEIAEIMGISQNLVLQRLFRGRKQLHTMLTEETE